MEKIKSSKVSGSLPSPPPPTAGFPEMFAHPPPFSECLRSTCHRPILILNIFIYSNAFVVVPFFATTYYTKPNPPGHYGNSHKMLETRRAFYIIPDPYIFHYLPEYIYIYFFFRCLIYCGFILLSHPLRRNICFWLNATRRTVMNGDWHRRNLGRGMDGKEG